MNSRYPKYKLKICDEGIHLSICKANRKNKTVKQKTHELSKDTDIFPKKMRE